MYSQVFKSFLRGTINVKKRPLPLENVSFMDEEEGRTVTLESPQSAPSPDPGD